ncbi:alpha-L-arabinofuranosidase C-terminal domain-containing protein, partial [Proteus mirabilis]|uniref:alpha-L-arabinofuranosidase C-terminal domain-containing protein n=2 Tax=Bacteria TaxID=2 RepID=UPI000F1E27FD
TWFDVEPGTNPGFLYQQNTIRDALVAGLTLNIFHEHNDRVVMANIAQIVNVLQSVILTEGEKMILTPTYHVFDMYKVHQDAERLATNYSGADYEMDGEKIPQVSVTASKDQAGKIHVSLCNVSHAEQSDVTIQLRGLSGAVSKIVGRQLASDSLDAHNTFESPETLK